METLNIPIWVNVTGRRGVILPSGEFVERPANITRDELADALIADGALPRPPKIASSIASAILDECPDSLVALCFDKNKRLIITHIHHVRELSGASFRASFRTMPSPGRVRSVIFAARRTITPDMQAAAIEASKNSFATITDFVKC